MSRNIGAAAIAIILLSMSCFLVSRDEVVRATSPAGDIDAVLIETNGGATTSFGYLVYLVPHGRSTRFSASVASLYGAARSEQAYGVNLRWRSPDHLALEYQSARSQELQQARLRVGERLVHVELVAGVTDPAAPPGGMLYNLQGRPHDPPAVK